MKVNKTFNNGDTATVRFDSAWTDGKIYRIERCMMKKLIDLIVFLFTFKGAIADKNVESGLIDYSGQGRDKNGR